MNRPERVNPQKMAAVYWMRLGRRALRDIDLIIAQYEDSPPARDYWLIVRAFVEDFAKKNGRRH